MTSEYNDVNGSTYSKEQVAKHHENIYQRPKRKKARQDINVSKIARKRGVEINLEARNWPYLCELCKGLFETKLDFICHLIEDHEEDFDDKCRTKC